MLVAKAKAPMKFHPVELLAAIEAMPAIECATILPMAQTLLFDDNPWNLQKLYIVLLLSTSNARIANHLRERNQGTGWVELLNCYVPNLVHSHMRFELTASGFVRSCLDAFFIL